MGNRNHHQGKRPKHRGGAAPPPAVRTPPTLAERKPPVVYGKPFVLLEDTQKATFIFKSGKWVQHVSSIAECKIDCQVKQLPQQINGMTRYEVCAPE
jgi:hypothetical protein